MMVFFHIMLTTRNPDLRRDGYRYRIKANLCGFPDGTFNLVTRDAPYTIFDGYPATPKAEKGPNTGYPAGYRYLT
jgi:hypothetical protein